MRGSSRVPEYGQVAKLGDSEISQMYLTYICAEERRVMEDEAGG
jgi:hypothetical protein